MAHWLFSLEETLSFTKERILHSFGGKAFGLWQAATLELSLPQTWFLSIDCFESFLSFSPPFSEKKAEEWLREKLKDVLDILPSCLFAVRSSSQFEDAHDHSFAGIFQSKLGIDKRHLPQAIAAVWASCHSLKVSSYTSAADLKMGVILQTFVQAKYAGVAFSRHPSPSSVFDNHHLVIEFASSSGEAVVQGEVTPFRLSGNPADLLLATDAHWMEGLVSTLNALLHHLRYEVDIEFVIDEQEKFWLVQQRPISRLHASNILDLSAYERRYKRALWTLDTELLIEGCSRFLGSYLETPYSLERWMVMITGGDGIQELWIHQALDQAIVSFLAQKIESDASFLTRLQDRYSTHHRLILEQDYSALFLAETPLEKRFFAFCEWILPLEAHYYVPMLMLDALHQLLHLKMAEIDPKKAEEDLFMLGTWGVSSLRDILDEKLRAFKIENPSLPSSFEMLSQNNQDQLFQLAEQYGFIKCRDGIERGYTAHELFALLKELPKHHLQSSTDYQKLLEKYFPEKGFRERLEAFREWMRVRNQEMEYYLYALQKARPLFVQLAETLRVSLEEIWSSSKEKILKAFQMHQAKILHMENRDSLTIHRNYGKTHVQTSLDLLYPEKETDKMLRGKTVVGKGVQKAKVKIAFTPAALQDFHSDEPTVLVTGMTTPDFIPYLRTSFCALITDEGGILCHAAIVAREIPIPTIVGTRTATEELKEGSWVEIDFDRGKVLLID